MTATVPMVFTEQCCCRICKKYMRLINHNGAALIELLAVAPFIAAFIMAALQFGALFTQAVHDVAAAEADVVQLINKWDLEHFQNGFDRPCLENMNFNEIKYGGNGLPVGFGIWKTNIGVSQGVRFVAEAICDPR